MLRLIEPDGKRGTWFTNYLDQGTLKQIVVTNDAKLKGVIELVAEVPAENLKALSSDKAVFLADPSADDCFVNNPKKKYINGLYWFLENNGMVRE